jgi:hypothetical protein
VEDLGLRETTDTLNDPFVPAVFVLAPGLRVHSAYNGYWYWGRPTAAELVADLGRSPARSGPTGTRRHRRHERALLDRTGRRRTRPHDGSGAAD